MLDWLMLSLSGSSSHELAPWTVWHARTMVLAWGVLLPVGVLLARYFKVWPNQRWPERLDHKAWWHGHRTLQYAGVGLMTLGAYLAWGLGARATPAAQAHAWLGWGVIAVGWLQVVMGLLRGSKGGPTDASLRGDHYDMTPYRQRFERLHKSFGWLSMGAAIIVIALGLWVADAPRWMPLVLFAWWCLLAALAWRWQRAGRCVDTYQAIWGPDPKHPGNHRQPIGWGVRRPTPMS
jgi:hypothetical protein